jgi:SAM-dependent methyltransferase
MALYDLVMLRKQLEENLVVDVAVDELLMLHTRISNIKLQVPVLPPEHASYINQLLDHYDNVMGMVYQPIVDLEKELSLINSQINAITKKLFDNNYDVEIRYGDVEHTRNSRRMYINQDIEELIKNRIFLHTDWKYPCLEIGCRDGEWTQFLVASDPLYIVDRHEEFLISTSSRFTPEYQRRLRPYHLKNNDLTMLPQNQFGFIFSWGYFNYITLETINKYLNQAINLLRPGGVFFFSYNDGDTPSGAGMAENFAQTYVPKSLLKSIIDENGFEIVHDFNNGDNVSWIEIKKPGTLCTVKAHQVMGEIKPIGT